MSPSSPLLPAFTVPFTLRTTSTFVKSTATCNSLCTSPSSFRTVRARSPCMTTTSTPTSPPSSKPLSSVTSTASLSFSKYHGLGNDFILIDNRHSDDPVLSPSRSASLCDRHTGIGADGVIFLLPPSSSSSPSSPPPKSKIDFRMRIYNSDGTEPEMCGNGIRCLAKFAHDINIVPKSMPNQYIIDTLAGEMVAELIGEGNELVRVDMGAPIVQPPSAIPTLLSEFPVSTIHDVENKNWEVTCVSMGNPHAVTFVEDEGSYREIDERLESLGPKFEHHEMFPQRTNTEFVLCKSETEMWMCVWERGAGRTRACGTGACAVVVAGVLTGRAQKDKAVVVHLPGGDLMIEWESKTNHVMMTGGATFVYKGDVF